MKKRAGVQEVRIKIKNLKSDLEHFQEQLDKLLESVPENMENNGMCVGCEQYADCYELPCHHLLCHSCHQYQNKHKKVVTCPLCQGYIHSSSSSEDL